MKFKLILFFSVLCLFLSSCSSSNSAVSCKMKPLKHKKYSTRKKFKPRKVVSARKATKPSRKQNRKVREPEPQIQKQVEQPIPTPIEEPKIDPVEKIDVLVSNTPEIKPEEEINTEVKEPILEVVDIPEPPKIEEVEVEEEELEDEIPTIADSKVNMPPEEEGNNLESIVEDLQENEEYKFDQEIIFINTSDLFFDRDEAIESISELAKVLKDDKNLQVTIVGNTATNVPDGTVIYGDNLGVYSQPAILNNSEVTIYDVMLARANRVKELLQSKGVREEQIRRKAGSHRKYAKDRVVSFILKRDEK